MARILFADDDDFMRGLVVSVLGAYAVDAVESGEKALERLRQDPSLYNLLVTDWTMKGALMNGPDLIKTVRSDRSLGDIRIILHSSHSDPPKELAGLEFTYVKKDFEHRLQTLVVAVKQVFAA